MRRNKLVLLILTTFLVSNIPVIPIYAANIWPSDFGLSGREIPFRPPDKYVTEQNPPDFSWPMIDSAINYDIKVCRDKTLSDIAYYKNGIKNNFYNFNEEFEIGTYYWSVRYFDGSSYSSWTEARRFRIDTDANSFPVESIDQLINKISATHPRIWTNNNSLEDFRALKDTYEGKEYLNKITNEIYDYMHSPMEQEPIAADYPTEDDLFYNLRLKKVYNMTNPMTKGALIYLLTGNKTIGSYAVSVLNELSKWDINGVTSYAVQDQVHREIAYMSAICYDWLYDLLSDSEKTSILNMIKARTEIMYNDLISSSYSLAKMPYNSHGWTALGYIIIISIAMQNDIPEAETWLRETLPLFANASPVWGYEDGGWSQGTYYYSAGSSNFIKDILRTSGIINLNNKAYFKNEINFPLYNYPKGSVGAFGDSSYTPPGPSIMYNYSRMASQYNNGIAKWAQEEIGDIEECNYINDGNLSVHTFINIMDKYYAVQKEIPLSMPKGKVFKDIGWASMHSDLIDESRISMFFKSSPFGSYNHSHGDQNTFVIQAFGERLAIDSGYYAYGTDWENNYVRQTFAHNGVTADNGKGQTINSFLSKGKIEEFITTSDLDMVSGDATAAYNNLDKAKRKVIYVRPNTFIIIDDLKTKNQNGSNFEFWLNGMKNSILSYNNNSATIKQGVAQLDANVLYPMNITSKYSNTFTDANFNEIQRPAKWSASDTQERVWFITNKALETKMITTLNVHKENESSDNIQTTYYNDYVKLVFSDDTTIYIKTTNAETVTADNIVFKGDAVVIKNDVKMLVSGTYLKIDNNVFMDSDNVVSYYNGKGLIKISADNDTNLNTYALNMQKITDDKSRALTPFIGVTYSYLGNNLSLSVDKGDYTFLINNSNPNPIISNVSVNSAIDNISTKINCKKAVDLSGNSTIYGNLNNNEGYYKIIDKSNGFEIANGNIGDTVFLNENSNFTVYNVINPYIVLESSDNIDYTGTSRVSVSISGSGTVSPSEEQIVSNGETIAFECLPDNEYYISSIKFNGVEVCVNVNNVYTTPKINKDSILEVIFEQKPSVSKVSGFEKTFYPSYKSSITFGTVYDSIGFEIIEYGILYHESETEITIDTPGVRKFPAKVSKNAKGQFGIELKDIYDILGERYNTRVYAIFEKEGITLPPVYSEIVNRVIKNDYIPIDNIKFVGPYAESYNTKLVLGNSFSNGTKLYTNYDNIVCSNLDDRFKNSAYIVTFSPEKGDVPTDLRSNWYGDLKDWITFDIHKSATIRIFTRGSIPTLEHSYYNFKQFISTDQDGYFKAYNTTYDEYTTINQMYTKYIFVNEGDKKTVKLPNAAWQSSKWGYIILIDFDNEEEIIPEITNLSYAGPIDPNYTYKVEKYDNLQNGSMLFCNYDNIVAANLDSAYKGKPYIIMDNPIAGSLSSAIIKNAWGNALIPWVTFDINKTATVRIFTDGDSLAYGNGGYTKNTASTYYFQRLNTAYNTSTDITTMYTKTYEVIPGQKATVSIPNAPYFGTSKWGHFVVVDFE